MDKKTYLLKALEALKDKWDLARGWILIIQNLDASNAIIEILIQAIESSLKKIKDQKTHQQFSQARDYLQKLKNIEGTVLENDQKVLEELDSLLTQI